MTRTLRMLFATGLLGLFLSTAANADAVKISIRNDSGYAVDYGVASPGQAINTAYTVQPGATATMYLDPGIGIYTRWSAYGPQQGWPNAGVTIPNFAGPDNWKMVVRGSVPAIVDDDAPAAGGGDGLLGIPFGQ